MLDRHREAGGICVQDAGGTRGVAGYSSEEAWQVPQLDDCPSLRIMEKATGRGPEAKKETSKGGVSDECNDTCVGVRGVFPGMSDGQRDVGASEVCSRLGSQSGVYAGGPGYATTKKAPERGRSEPKKRVQSREKGQMSRCKKGLLVVLVSEPSSLASPTGEARNERSEWVSDDGEDTRIHGAGFGESEASFTGGDRARWKESRRLEIGPHGPNAESVIETETGVIETDPESAIGDSMTPKSGISLDSKVRPGR